jgi:hypothetical protein
MCDNGKSAGISSPQLHGSAWIPVEQELPPILSGLDATGIQEESRRAIDEVLSILHQGE